MLTRDTMVEVLCGLKVVLALFLVWYTEALYSAIALISFLPLWAKDFISETKEIIAYATTILIFFAALKNFLKKDKKN